MSELDLKYLIVEYNKADVELALYDFKENGMKSSFHIATNSDEAFNYLFAKDSSLKVDLPKTIFLDLHLPKTSDGLDLLSNIRQNEKTKNIPVVILTCSAHPRSIDECKRLGVSVFIEKPLLYANFIEAIRNIDK